MEEPVAAVENLILTKQDVQLAAQTMPEPVADVELLTVGLAVIKTVDQSVAGIVPQTVAKPAQQLAPVAERFAEPVSEPVAKCVS